MKLSLLCLLAVYTLQARTTASCTVGLDGNPYIESPGVNRPSVTAYGTFDDTIFEVGHGQLHIVTTRLNVPVDDIFLCAGAVEGFLTHKRISDTFYILKTTDSEFADKEVYEFLRKNIEYVKERSEYPEDTWWENARRIFQQVKGLEYGYRQAKSVEEERMDFIDFWAVNSAGDVGDIYTHLHADPALHSKVVGGKKVVQFRDQDWKDTHHHCTGMIALNPSKTEIYMAQNAWSNYNSNNRIAKDYNMKAGNSSFEQMVISSYPAKLASYDDFWILGNGLFVLETTMSNHKDETTIEHVKPESVLSWMRILIANRISVGGSDWTVNAMKENSGTYNNQYCVLDMKKFTSRVQQDVVWCVEQMPGFNRRGDRSAEFFEKRYIPSINKPFWEETSVYAGYPEQIIEDGCDYNSYENCCRMKIIKRDWPKFTANYTEFKLFMRYNDWKNDELSLGDAASGMMSRYDQRPNEGVKMGNLLLKKRSFGGLDTKTATHIMAMNLTFDILTSPQYETQPTWVFGTDPFFNDDWKGLPTQWKFPWTTFKGRK